MSNTLINYIKQHNRLLKLFTDCFMKCNAFDITCCIDMDSFTTTSKAIILVTIYRVLRPAKIIAIIFWNFTMF